jgi:hypothetical protein
MIKKVFINDIHVQLAVENASTTTSEMYNDLDHSFEQYLKSPPGIIGTTIRLGHTTESIKAVLIEFCVTVTTFCKGLITEPYDLKKTIHMK